MSKSHLLVVLSVGGLLLWFFAPALGGGQSLAYRDSAHFYHPLFEYIRGEWGAGRWPLWNPHEGIGLTLAAQPTASVFYPGKLLFALPFDYTLLYNLYVVAHVALAAFTSFRLARHWGASAAGAGIAAISYAFSGNVLFQYSNVVYLVGAAWLPLAFEMADRMLREQRLRSAIGLGVVLALMILGGDPQMAYSAALIAVLYAVLQRRSTAEVASPGGRGSGRAFTSATYLAIAAVTCFCLAAIQILPSWQAARTSTRAAYDSPRSVYELAAHVVASRPDADAPQLSWYSGLLGDSGNAQQRTIYEFSVGPWRAIEYVWPNIYGRQFPTHRRWLAALPAEGRVWTPSLYMGLLPLVLAAATWSVRRSAALEVRLASWMVLLSALASLGIYGAVWLVREVAGLFGASISDDIGGEVGGLYWLLTVLLPGYVYFRYPAKLLLVAALGLSLLAARGWDDAWHSRPQRIGRTLVALAIGSLVALLVVLVVWPTWSSALLRMDADPLFGPFDAAGAQRDIVGGLVQTIVISLALYALAAPFVRASTGAWGAPLALAITVVDLACAQSWLVASAPSDSFNFEPDVIKTIALGRTSERIYRDPYVVPLRFREVASPDRLNEIVRFERESAAPKYPLPYGLSLVESSSTIDHYDMRVLMEVARAHAGLPQQKNHSHASVLDLLATEFAILPRTSAVQPADYRPYAGDNVILAERPHARPRAWIVHDVETLPTLRSQSSSAVKRRTEEVLFPGGQPRDWTKVAVVEIDEPLPITPQPVPPDAREFYRITGDDPSTVTIDANLASPGLIVLSDAFDPGWTLRVESDRDERDVPILRTNRVMRGALLPAGRHRLVYQYRARLITTGAIISGVTLVVVLLVLAGSWRMARQPPGKAGG